ncbi:MAG: 3-oxoacyl-[acyl-carrier-protein] reductase [Proteobacteria bacterium]|jgi:3-oxoacyl-[acyl-carrier protein] reductase|nr:3-oxoacyl-[acyl-carrier-protein] reductase [Pseudomonadota bacterium]
MDKKNVLVTGCSRGIGLAIAKKLIDEGYFVVGTSRSKIDLANLLGSDNCLHQAVDVSNEDDISSMIESLTKQDIHIHCLVNNAGITKDQLFMRMNSDDWNSVINTNLNGVFYLTKSLIKSMVKSKYGRIVNISSVAGLMGNAGQVNYASSKAALSGFTKSLAKELASRNITVNNVCPGFIESDMTKELSDAQIENALQQIPLQRFGTAEEVASLVAYLLSDAANYITGQELSIDGGMYI